VVQVRDIHSAPVHDHADLDVWFDKVAEKCRLDKPACESLRHATELVKEAEVSAALKGESPFQSSSLQTGLEIVEILADLHMDSESLQAGVLYRAVREGKLPIGTVRRHFGEGVVTLIENVLRMALISGLRNDSEAQALGQDASQQAGKIREMLVSVIDDVRVALLKLAERTCAIRAVKEASEDKRMRVAREILDVYAPLAHRLGIGYLKWELEDLAFRYLEADEYQEIAHLLDEKRIDRQQYIEDAIATIKGELDSIGKRNEVSGRVKHIYSILRKMHRKGIGFSQVYDIRAIRVLVPTVSDCYAVLGIVHSKWRNIPNEFDDYIASPKENGYRSLHTAVIGPGRKVVEIQIRTYEMHEEAELGICAHWEYKGGDSAASGENYEEKIAWLRQVLEWHENIGGSSISNFIELEGEAEQVYVFTPEGHVIDLPVGATAVDFAYRVHTQVGHRCRGVKINGETAALNTTLKTGEQVEIITGKIDAPRRDWLTKSLGYLKTARGRAKVQQWFRTQNKAQNIEAGRGILDREFRYLALDLAQIESIASKFNKPNSEALYAAIGAGDIGYEQVISAVQDSSKVVNALPPAIINASRFENSEFYIYGVGSSLTHIASCCEPRPEEGISGYLTTRHGVNIHREDCAVLLRLQSEEPRRLLQVSWGRAPEQRYAARVRVTSYDRAGLLRDITGVVDKEGLFIGALNSGEMKEGVIQTDFSIDVSGIEELGRVLAKLCQISNVIEACRLSDKELENNEG